MARRVGLDRAQVLDTAAAQADARAPEPLTLQALAAELGIQKPSLYNYVDGLPGLERELALRASHMLTEQFAEAAIGKSGDIAVEAVASSFRRFILEHPGLYALSVRASRNREQDDQELRAIEEKAIRIIATVLSPYSLTRDELVHAIRGLRSFVHGFATLQAAGGFGLSLSLDESFQYLVQSYIHTLRVK